MLGNSLSGLGREPGSGESYQGTSSFLGVTEPLVGVEELRGGVEDWTQEVDI